MQVIWWEVHDHRVAAAISGIEPDREVPMSVKMAVVNYSATGSVHARANAMAEGAEKAARSSGSGGRRNLRGGP